MMDLISLMFLVVGTVLLIVTLSILLIFIRGDRND